MGAATNPIGALMSVIGSVPAISEPIRNTVTEARPFIEENRQASATSSPTAPMQTANTGTVYNQTFTITINAAPGMSPEQVAAQVERKFREQTSRNGQMFDGFY
jgi:acetylornithine deacetylase/succinyl-diaminopimelate desuccinylase-like protein